MPFYILERGKKKQKETACDSLSFQSNKSKKKKKKRKRKKEGVMDVILYQYIPPTPYRMPDAPQFSSYVVHLVTTYAKVNNTCDSNL